MPQTRGGSADAHPLPAAPIPDGTPTHPSLPRLSFFLFLDWGVGCAEGDVGVPTTLKMLG
ncbi:hypothetical protein JCM4814A_78610 [Streptomyces phaeofaciens JCM 4814]